MNVINLNKIELLKSRTFKIREVADRLGYRREINALNLDEISLSGTISQLTSFAIWELPNSSDRWEDVNMREVMDYSHQKLLNWKGFDPEDRNTLLHAEIIMLGLNVGSGGLDYVFDHFEVFHDNNTGPKKVASNIKRYLPELLDTTLKGAYMTDVYKGIPTLDGSNLKKTINESAESLGYKGMNGKREFLNKINRVYAEVLIEELSIVGVPKYFVIMGSRGGMIDQMLDTHEGLSTIKRLWLPHYSGSGPKGTKNYHRNAVLKLEKELQESDHDF